MTDSNPPTSLYRGKSAKKNDAASPMPRGKKPEAIGDEASVAAAPTGPWGAKDRSKPEVAPRQSGRPDRQRDKHKPAQKKTVDAALKEITPESEPRVCASDSEDAVRLARRVTELAGCSRREAELYIVGGWVQVDGVVIEEPQFRVSTQQVTLLPGADLTSADPVTLILHLPAGQTADVALKALAQTQQWAEDPSGVRPLKHHLFKQKACIPLQNGASGMQLLTQDWRTERRLTDDARKLEQEYIVEVRGSLKDEALKRLNKGFSHQDKLLPCKVSWQNETHLRVALKNPQPDQIRQMCESVGLELVGMKRIRIGGVAMSKLPVGQWRYVARNARF